MKNTYKIDFVNNTLTMSKAFEEALNNPNSQEYKLFLQLRADFPGLTIIRKTRRAPKKARPTKNLTYKHMEQYHVRPRADPVLFVLRVYGHTRRGQENALTEVHVTGAISQSFAAALGTEPYFLHKSSGVGQFLYPFAIIIHDAKRKFISIVGINLFLYQVIPVPGAENFIPLPVVWNSYFLIAVCIVIGGSAAARRVGFAAA